MPDSEFLILDKMSQPSEEWQEEHSREMQLREQRHRGIVRRGINEENSVEAEGW